MSARPLVSSHPASPDTRRIDGWTPPPPSCLAVIKIPPRCCGNILASSFNVLRVRTSTSRRTAAALNLSGCHLLIGSLLQGCADSSAD